MIFRKPLMGPALGLGVLMFLAPASGNAQYEEGPPPAAYALRNVTVFRADGTHEGGVNLVIRRGLIAAMGVGIQIPADAQVLEGDSLRVYPGLVDAHGSADLDLPGVVNPGDVLSWDTPRDAQGFTPHRLAAHYLEASGGDVRAQRIAGVIAAGVHPSGGMAPGQSTAVIHRKTTKTPWDLVAQSSVGLLFSFQGGRGGYPSSLFAVIAHFRQMFEDAARHALIASEYRGDPRGMSVPRWDPDLEVLAGAAAGAMPVFFLADEDEDIRRVLMLADEIGFRPVIVGGEEAWQIGAELASRNIPVLVSVAFPTPREWEPPEAGGGEGPEATSAGSGALEPAAAREKERLENAYANASRLVEAGVEIALTSGGGGGDLREGARKAMEYGLSETEALRAVTTNPASILGIPHVTSLAEGMSASFIVSDGPLFEEETGIRYTFVEGEMEEGSRVRSATGDEAPGVDVTGTWDVTLNTQGMEMPLKMVLSQEGASFSGTLTNEEMPGMGSSEVVGGIISGIDMTFTLVFSMGAESREMEVSGTVEGNRMTGSGSGEMGEFQLTGARNPGAEGGLR